MPDFCGLAAGKKNNFFNMHFHLSHTTTKQNKNERKSTRRQAGRPQPTRRLEATLSQIAHIRGLPSDFTNYASSAADLSKQTLRTDLSNWLPTDLSKRASSAAVFSQHSWPHLAERQPPSVPQHSRGTLLPHNRQHPPKSHTHKPVG